MLPFYLLKILYSINAKVLEIKYWETFCKDKVSDSKHFGFYSPLLSLLQLTTMLWAEAAIDNI